MMSAAAAAEHDETAATATAVCSNDGDTALKQANRASDEAMAKMIEGKRHTRLGDHAAATDCFQEALELMVTTHGEMASECSEAYFLYGQSLVKTARRDDVDILDSNATAATNADAAAADDDNDDDDGNDAVNEDEGEEGGGGDDTTCDADDLEDVTGELQVAWEVLEVARILYSKIPGGEAQIQLGKTLQLLGEVNLENENYTQAVENFTHCIEIRTKCMEPDDRNIIVAYFQVALAHSMLPDSTDAATEAFNQVKSLVCSRIQRLETTAQTHFDGKGKGKVSDTVSAAKEVTELRGILDEVAAKMAELEDADKVRQEDEARALAQIRTAVLGGAESTGNAFSKPVFGTSSSNTGSTGATAPSSGFDLPSSSKATTVVNDLSSLVKKRPTAESAAAPFNVRVSKTDGDYETSLKRPADISADNEPSPKKATTE